MAWKQTDYNPIKMKTFSDIRIRTEFRRIQSVVKSRVKTFQKHQKPGEKLPAHVREMIDIMSQKNTSRRDREKAIMEYKRFLRSARGSYTQYQRYMKDSRATWRGYGLNIRSNSEFTEFFEFLEWAKSFYGGKYELNSIIESWNLSPGRVDTAKKLFELNNDSGFKDFLSWVKDGSKGKKKNITSQIENIIDVWNKAKKNPETAKSMFQALK